MPITITRNAENEAEDIKTSLQTDNARKAFSDEVKKNIGFLQDGYRLGTRIEGTDSARQIVMYKGKVLMRYDEPEPGNIEIFDFLFASRNQ